MVLQTFVCIWFCPSLPSFLFFFFSHWCFATNPCRAFSDNPPSDTHVVASTDDRPSSGDNVRCALKPHCDAGSLPNKACSTIPVSGTEGLESVVEISSAAAIHLQVVVVCSLVFLCNNLIKFSVVKLTFLFNRSNFFSSEFDPSLNFELLLLGRDYIQHSNGKFTERTRSV